MRPIKGFFVVMRKRILTLRFTKLGAFFIGFSFSGSSNRVNAACGKGFQAIHYGDDLESGSAVGSLLEQKES